jgi:hypothetical protein
MNAPDEKSWSKTSSIATVETTQRVPARKGHLAQQSRMRPVLLLSSFLLLSACGSGGAPASPSVRVPAGESTEATNAWLCRPDLPVADDPCRSADLSATELHADGTRTVVAHHAADKPLVDCFYVYPTVDLELVPGNHKDLVDTRRMRATTLAQAARFTEACSLWVPLYHQVTIGTYLQSKETLERGLALAFTDIERAFAEYLTHAGRSRKVVLIGHSQGAEMVNRLLRRFFDDDPAMRERLLLALSIGGDVDTVRGTTRGGTTRNIPACSRPDETGCIVAYRSHAAGERVDADRWAPPAGRETVCVNPAPAGAEPRHLSRAYFAVWPELRRFMHGVSDVTTPFVLLRDFYDARCVRGPDGYAWLEVSTPAAANDKRKSPIDLHDRRFRIGNLGLHVLDMQFAQGDLVDMVARRAGLLRSSGHETEERQ